MKLENKGFTKKDVIILFITLIFLIAALASLLLFPLTHNYFINSKWGMPVTLIAFFAFVYSTRNVDLHSDAKEEKNFGQNPVFLSRTAYSSEQQKEKEWHDAELKKIEELLRENIDKLRITNPGKFVGVQDGKIFIGDSGEDLLEKLDWSKTLFIRSIDRNELYE